MNTVAEVEETKRKLKVYSDLERILKERKISFKSVAEQISPVKSHYNSLWESIKKQTAKFETLEKIGEILGVDLVVEYRQPGMSGVEEPVAEYSKPADKPKSSIEMAYRETIEALKGALKDKERIIELQEKFIQTKK